MKTPLAVTARLSWLAEMVENLERVASSDQELTVEERNLPDLLNILDEHVIGISFAASGKSKVFYHKM